MRSDASQALSRKQLPQDVAPPCVSLVCLPQQMDTAHILQSCTRLQNYCAALCPTILQEVTVSMKESEQADKQSVCALCRL